MKFVLFCFGLFLILAGCGGGVPTDYSGDEWGEEETSSTSAAGSTPTTDAETAVKQPSDTTASPPETGGKKFVPGRYSGELTPQLEADMREIRTKYKDWLKSAMTLSKQHQERTSVNMAEVKSTLQEGMTLAQKAQNIADELRKLNPTKYGHDINSYTSVANDISHYCYILREIMVTGR